MSELTERAEGLSLSAGGRRLVGKAGVVPVRRLADKVGLTGALSGALVRRGFHPVHDRGGVLVSAACAVLLGARSIAGIAVMRQAALVLGQPGLGVGAVPHAGRDRAVPAREGHLVAGEGPLPGALLLHPGGFPWIRVDGRELTGWSVLDVDASYPPTRTRRAPNRAARAHPRRRCGGGDPVGDDGLCSRRRRSPIWRAGAVLEPSRLPVDWPGAILAAAARLAAACRCRSPSS